MAVMELKINVEVPGIQEYRMVRKNSAYTQNKQPGFPFIDLPQEYEVPFYS